MTDPPRCHASILGEDDVVHQAAALPCYASMPHKLYVRACELIAPLAWHPRVRAYELVTAPVTCIACLGSS